MQSLLPDRVNDLIAAFGRLPGVGPKMASRISFYLLQKGREDVHRLNDAIAGVVDSLTTCRDCGLISDQELCPICRDDNRQKNLICVVEDSLDVLAFERAGTFRGLYHVLGGVLSPIDGVGPDQLRLNELLARIKEWTEPGEVIVAVNPSLEGEATTDYLQTRIREVAPTVIVSRIARGLPMGSDVEYADPTTLLRALEGRREVTA